MQALVENGPMAVSYMVYSDFYGYNGGIYHHTGLRDRYNPFEMTSHAVTLVGYGVEPSTGEKFWSIKNSWGKWWGERAVTSGSGEALMSVPLRVWLLTLASWL